MAMIEPILACILLACFAGSITMPFPATLALATALVVVLATGTALAAIMLPFSAVTLRSGSIPAPADPKCLGLASPTEDFTSSHVDLPPAALMVRRIDVAHPWACAALRPWPESGSALPCTHRGRPRAWRPTCRDVDRAMERLEFGANRAHAAAGLPVALSIVAEAARRIQSTVAANPIA